MAKRRVKVGKFESDGPESASADVSFDGVKIGEIERVRSDEFASATSRARKWVVSEYTMRFDAVGLEDIDAPVRRRDAKAALAGLLEEIEEAMVKAGGVSSAATSPMQHVVASLRAAAAKLTVVSAMSHRLELTADEFASLERMSLRRHDAGLMKNATSTQEDGDMVTLFFRESGLQKVSERYNAAPEMFAARAPHSLRVKLLDFVDSIA